jgi:hypothetical protein
MVPLATNKIATSNQSKKKRRAHPPAATRRNKPNSGYRDGGVAKSPKIKKPEEVNSSGGITIPAKI